MKTFLTLFTFSTLALGANAAIQSGFTQRVNIQPGGWVKINPSVETEVYCVGSSRQILKFCRCDYDTDNKYRAELVLITDGQQEKVTALTPYIYVTYESCMGASSTHAACQTQGAR